MLLLLLINNIILGRKLYFGFKKEAQASPFPHLFKTKQIIKSQKCQSELTSTFQPSSFSMARDRSGLTVRYRRKYHTPRALRCYKILKQRERLEQNHIVWNGSRAAAVLLLLIWPETMKNIKDNKHCYVEVNWLISLKILFKLSSRLVKSWSKWDTRIMRL